MTQEPLVQAQDQQQFGRDRLQITGTSVALPGRTIRIPQRPLTHDEKLSLAASQLADESAWFRLVHEGDREIQVAIARNPKATRNVLELLARTGCEQAQIAVATHPQITPSLLGMLAKSPNPKIVEAVATHPMTPPAVLEQLVHTPDPNVRAAALRHPRLSPETIAEALTGTMGARVGVARNPQLTREELEGLLEQAVSPLLSAMLRHPKLDEALFARLLAHPAADDEFLLLAVRHRLMTPPGLIGVLESRPSFAVKEAILRSPRLVPLMLIKLGQDADPRVRAMVASHPLTPLPCLMALIHDGHEDVRVGLLKHPHLPLAVIEAIATGRDTALKIGIACRPGVPDEILAYMLRTKSRALHEAVLRRPKLSKRLGLRLAHSFYVELRYELAQRPGLPAAIADELARDGNWVVREAALRSGRVSPALREQMLADPVYWVRLTADNRAPFWPWEHRQRERDFEAAFAS